MFIASIDIGSKNFCIYVEETNMEELKELAHNEIKYNMDGTPTLESQNILNKSYANGKTIFHENYNLTFNGKANNLEILLNMYECLENINDILKKCHVVLIEKQMNKNIKAIKLGQHCLSYFLFKFKNEKEIIEFPAYHKTQVLGAIKTQAKNGKWNTLKQTERKKWVVGKTYDILSSRNEIGYIDRIKSTKKRDDLADTLCTCQSFKILRFVKKTI